MDVSVEVPVVEEHDSNTGHLYTYVEEAKELEEFMRETVESPEKRKQRERFDRFGLILERYQEQPQLLDSMLEGMVVPLMQLARENTENIEELNNILRAVYVLTKVRGYKTVERFFPHEVIDFERTLTLLENQKSDDFESWETRYVLLLWFSIIVIIPFDLIRFDSNTGGVSLMDRIINVSKRYLQDSGRTREAAAILLSRALTRPDSGPYLHQFFLWSSHYLTSNETKNPFLITGIFAALAAISKRGKRQELLEELPIIFSCLDRVKLNSVAHRKLLVKLVQRIGLTYLKPKIASWRYQRGNRSILANLGKGGEAKGTSEIAVTEEEEETDVPEEIEGVIEHLIRGLKDKDTVVRWSSAKGIGRITSRLPKEFADEVVGSFMDFFNIGEGDEAWHGACLALAELAKRGLLLPSRLESVIPLVINALQYDERRGAHSVGAHVRDAACYVCWAFGRAYSPQVMREYVTKLSNALMVVMVYDREVNCRRAAAAAFQENVGRQGSFPHGIDIITTADFFTVAVRNDSYTKISPIIAEFEEYRKSLIDHLAIVKINHWDRSLRELSAETIGLLTAKEPHYIIQKVLPSLLVSSLDPDDLGLRHGSILAVSHIIKATHKLGIELDEQTRCSIIELIPSVEKNRLYRGKGGEVMRHGVCQLIEAIATARIPLVRADPSQRPSQEVEGGVKKGIPSRGKEKSIGMIFQDTIDENIRYPLEDIQETAVQALRSFSRNCYSNPPKKSAMDLIDRYVKTLLTEENVATRRGMSLALGALPKHFLLPKLDEILDALITSSKMESRSDRRDAETRRNSVKSIIEIVQEIGFGCEQVSARRDKIFSSFLTCANDYAIDNRGDVGSWVREAAVKTMYRFVVGRLDCQDLPDGVAKVTEGIVKKMIYKLLILSLDRIDRLRGVAGKLLLRTLHHDPPVPFIPHHDHLSKLIPSNSPDKWAVRLQAFHVLTPLLQFEDLRESVLFGIIPTIGSSTATPVLESSNALLEYMKNAEGRGEEQLVRDIGKKITSMLQKYNKTDRFVSSCFKVCAQLLSNGCLSHKSESDTFGVDLLDATQKIVFQSRDLSKVTAGIYVFCWLLLFPDPVRSKSFQILLQLLTSEYPKVRRLTAEEMYVRVLTDEHIVDSEHVDQVMNILSTRKWDGGVTASMEEDKEKLYSLLRLERPTETSTLSANKKGGAGVDREYADLVKEAGY